MLITICGSISFAEDIEKIKIELEKRGHTPILPKSIKDFSIKNSELAEKLKADREKYLNEIKPQYTMEHFDNVVKSDAIVVVNNTKHGIENYIGGATFSEIMLAYYKGKKIFFTNPIPTDKMFDFVRDELESVKPIILNGNLDLVK